MTTASSKTAVFPSKVTNALMNLDRVFAQPQAQHVFAGSGSGQQVDNSRSFDDSMLNNFYGMKNNKDLMQRLAINRMRGRRR